MKTNLITAAAAAILLTAAPAGAAQVPNILDQVTVAQAADMVERVDNVLFLENPFDKISIAEAAHIAAIADQKIKVINSWLGWFDQLDQLE